MGTRVTSYNKCISLAWPFSNWKWMMLEPLCDLRVICTYVMIQPLSFMAIQQHSQVKKLLFSAIKSLNLSWSLSQIVLLMINHIFLNFFKINDYQLFSSFNLWQKTFPISSWVEELFFAGFTEWCKREKIQIWSHLSWPDNQQRGELGILNCYFIPWII